MTETKEMDAIHKNALKQFHTLCTKLGVSAYEKSAMLEAYGVESSRDLDTHDLVDLCGRLSVQAYHQQTELDKLRKRVMAAIGVWLRSEERKDSADIIKAIACRATGHEEFNKIPKERLRNLIALFNNKIKDREAVDALTSGKVVALPVMGHR